ncbi:hypothetical protein L1987_45964 [Smallanthus sonchifolius]|uniref:Uncharacterized protein n=1 Tax=Smallanthus sonchifolius TaxID=185202 RepID=A0ACB9FY84_9ASTR|nr:hypothetical protein L1987_45964 [Smallanthus sonchifolius]
MIQYLGGVTVLLSFLDNKSAVTAMEKARDIVGRFSKIELWEGQVLNVDRIAWLRIFGMPLQLLRNEVLDSVGRLFGTIVQNANVLEEEGDLSSEFIGVLIGNGRRVSREVSVQWQDIVEEGVDEMEDREDLCQPIDGETMAGTKEVGIEEEGLGWKSSNLETDVEIDPHLLQDTGSGHCKGKKARSKDPVGLNDILGLEEEDRNVVMVQFNEEAADYNSSGGIDLNMDPSKWVETQQPDGGS